MQSLNLNAMKLSIAKPGTKATASNKAELFTASTINKLTLNPLATKKMGIANEDYVTILVNEEATNINEMYFITGGVEANKAKVASVGKAEGVGRTCNFNYGGVWGKMLQFKVDAMDMNPAGLVDEGLLSKYKTEAGKDAYVANFKVSFELGDAVEVEIEGEDVEIYPLINAKKEEYSSKVLDGEEVEVEEEVED